MPWIRPILSHQEVDLASHFHVVDSPASFIAFPLSPAARLLIVPPSLNVLNEPIHGEDSVEGPICTLHVPFLYHHSPGNELQVFCHNLGFKSALCRTIGKKRDGGRASPRRFTWLGTRGPGHTAGPPTPRPIPVHGPRRIWGGSWQPSLSRSFGKGVIAPNPALPPQPPFPIGCTNSLPRALRT